MRDVLKDAHLCKTRYEGWQKGSIAVYFRSRRPNAYSSSARITTNRIDRRSAAARLRAAAHNEVGTERRL